MHAFALYSRLMQPARGLRHGNGSPDEILSICLTQENVEGIPKLILAGEVRTHWWTMSTRYTCEKDVLALRLLKDN
jgi:hypothetical protein